MVIKKLCFAIICIAFVIKSSKLIKLLFSNREDKAKYIKKKTDNLEEIFYDEKNKWLYFVCFILMYAISILLFYGAGFFDILFQ